METFFESKHSMICLLNLNESFNEFNQYFINDTEISLQLQQIKIKIQDYICCMDSSITDSKNVAHNNFTFLALRNIKIYEDIIYANLISLFKLDEVYKLNKLFNSIMELNFIYKKLFSYTLKTYPYITNQKSITDIDGNERLLSCIFKYVKLRNESIDLNLPFFTEHYDHFSYKQEHICDFVKYSFHNNCELDFYAKFLLTNYNVFKEKYTNIILSYDQLIELIETEKIKFSNPNRIKYFVVSDKEQLIKKIKIEAYRILTSIGLVSKYEDFIQIFDFDRYPKENILQFHNPPKVPISFIIKLLIENHIISDKLKFKYKTTKTIKSPKGIITDTLAVFSKTLNNNENYKCDFTDLKLFDYKWIEKYKINLTYLIKLVRDLSKLI